MRCACVDIGSNTTRLLVGALDGDQLRTIAAERSFVGLPECVTGGPVGPRRAARLAAVVAAQVALARDHGAHRVRIVGTAALRAAADRDEVVAAVTRACGLPVAVLGADEEARLAFAGATHALRDGDRADPDLLLGVADVGGGSTELACGTLRGGVTWSASVALGSGVLSAAHLRSDPPHRSELAGALAAAQAALGALDVPQVELALAVGGGAASLPRLAGEHLDEAALAAALERACARRAVEVAALHGLHAERVRLLRAGLVLLGAAARAFGRPLVVARGGLREGVLLQELTRVSPA